jgi:hypothetical protein
MENTVTTAQSSHTLHTLHTPRYVPTYEWNDDERDTKTYIPYHDCKGDERYASYEYIPVYKIMKELYDEERYALCTESNDEYDLYFREDSYICDFSDYNDNGSDSESVKGMSVYTEEQEQLGALDEDATSNLLNNSVYFNKYCYT